MSHTWAALVIVLTCIMERGVVTNMTVSPSDSDDSDTSLEWTVSSTMSTTTTQTGDQQQQPPGKYDGEVRLVNGGDAYGRVEVWFHGMWGTICDDGWDDTDATTVCQQLGYRVGIAKYRAHYGQGRGKIWLTNVRCSSRLTTITDCEFDKFHVDDDFFATCRHKEDAGVDCTGTKPVVESGSNRLFLGLGIMVAFVAVGLATRMFIRRQHSRQIQNSRAQQAYRAPPRGQRTVGGAAYPRQPGRHRGGSCGGGGHGLTTLSGQHNMAFVPPNPVDTTVGVVTPMDQQHPATSGYMQQGQTLTPHTLAMYPVAQQGYDTCGVYPTSPLAPPAYEDVPTLPDGHQIVPGQGHGTTEGEPQGTLPLPPSYDSIYGSGGHTNKSDGKEE